MPQEMMSVVCTLLPEDPYEYMMNHVVQGTQKKLFSFVSPLVLGYTSQNSLGSIQPLDPKLEGLPEDFEHQQ